MTIVCATDFSEPAVRAATVSAVLAARAREPLKLVYALEPTSSFDVADSIAEPARQRGKAEAERLRKLGTVDVDERLVLGVPDEVIVDQVEELRAELVVLGALGRRAGGKWRLGSTADRTAQTSPVPLLVVRSSDAFEGWSDARPLRVVMGADFSAMTDSVVAWMRWFCQLGPCQVIAAHVYFPPGERRRLGVTGPAELGGAHPEIEAALERDLQQKIGTLPAAKLTIRAVAGLGNTADRLVELAQQERADLVVVGAHQRSFLGRLWHGSVSEGVIEQAPMNVACVPERAAEVVKSRVPDVRTILAATDFSRAGNAALPYAYSVLPTGGTVHLVHVGDTGADKAAIEARLRGLVPAEAAARKIETQVHVLEAHFPADAICHAADRLGAGLVVLGGKPRSGAVKVIVGSVAEGVMSRSTRPVLVVPAPKG
jgi:nucleotide-binding universal stress UspA family protein